MQFDEHLCDISHGFNWHGASRGLSAIAELLVCSCHDFYVFNVFVFVEQKSDTNVTLNSMLMIYFTSFATLFEIEEMQLGT